MKPVIPARKAIADKLSRGPGFGGIIMFGHSFAAGLIYVATHLISDLEVERKVTMRTFLMLGGALPIALGFEVVDGFDDINSKPYAISRWRGC